MFDDLFSNKLAFPIKHFHNWFGRGSILNVHLYDC